MELNHKGQLLKERLGDERGPSLVLAKWGSASVCLHVWSHHCYEHLHL